MTGAAADTAAVAPAAAAAPAPATAGATGDGWRDARALGGTPRSHADDVAADDVDADGPARRSDRQWHGDGWRDD